MAYLRVKTIKGRRYLYRQHSVRKGKKVHTLSQFLGALGSAGVLGVLAVRDAVGMDKTYLRRPQQSTHGRANKIQETHERELFDKDREAFNRMYRVNGLKEKAFRESEKQWKADHLSRAEKRERADEVTAAQKKHDETMEAIREFKEARAKEKEPPSSPPQSGSSS